MAIKKSTHRGHCQACGRIQSVLNDTNNAPRLAKHGYTVKGWGFFMGTCLGSDRYPLQTAHDHTDTIIVRLIKYADFQAALHKSYMGDAHPNEVDGEYTTRKVERKNRFGTYMVSEGYYPQVKWTDATADQRLKGKVKAMDKCKFEENNARSHVTHLEFLKKTIHGTALLPITRGADAIVVGSKVKVHGCVVTVTRIDEATCRGIGPSLNGQLALHVYWNNDKGQEVGYPRRFARLVM
jgi:hypothetical protein